MNLSVILIGYNSWHFLEKNLAALSFLEADTDSEIIYVDNGSQDHTIQKTKELYPHIKIIKNKKNNGVAVARNQALSKASGDYLWILDSDTIPTKEAMLTMLDFIKKRTDIGLCGCKMYGQDGKIQNSCRFYPTIGGKLKKAINILRKYLNPHFRSKDDFYDYDMAQDQPFEVDYVIGACQLIRREAFEKVGFLDENIFYGPEDADYCLRMKLKGYKVYYIPQVSIYHAYQRVSSHSLFSKLNLMHIKGLIYYFWKHKKA